MNSEYESKLSNNHRMAFTIIELLVVMVIISILVSITYVSYRGIQARSRSSTASAQAGAIARKAEAWYSALGAFPSYAQLSTNKINAGDATQTGPAEARVTDAAAILINASSADPTNEKQSGYRTCAAGGAQVEWYDAISSSVKYIGVGGAASTTACS